MISSESGILIMNSNYKTNGNNPTDMVERILIWFGKWKFPTELVKEVKMSLDKTFFSTGELLSSSENNRSSYIYWKDQILLSFSLKYTTKIFPSVSEFEIFIRN